MKMLREEGEKERKKTVGVEHKSVGVCLTAESLPLPHSFPTNFLLFLRLTFHLSHPSQKLSDSMPDHPFQPSLFQRRPFITYTGIE